MEATARFAALMAKPDAAIPLDEAATLIAAHAHPHLDVAHVLERLDRLAAESSATDAATLAGYLFREQGFAGNTVDYEDPRNSYLDDVLERRLGIPISLSVLMLETGRRLGITLGGVSMPGHFLVATGVDADTYVDPFHGGRPLDEDGCRELFHRVQGEAARFRPEYLQPVGARAIVTRMLANLQHTLLRRDPRRAAWVVRLRLRVPDTPPPERVALARLLGTLGRFGEAAKELDAIATAIGGDEAEQARRQAAALRARDN